MSAMKHAVRVLLLWSGLLSGGAVHSASSQEIWFGPRSNLADFMALFRRDAPWSEGASHVRVFEIADNFARVAPAQDLTQMADDLHRRGIMLSAGVLALSSRGEGSCGHRVEGYNLKGGPEALARGLHSLDITPTYFPMDEPLYYGHAFASQGDRVGCRRPIADVAMDVAETLRPVHELFPNARFGDVEPALALPLSDIEEWLDAFEHATGTKLAFFRIDMDWKRNWSVEVPPLAQLLHRKGVPFQVIYNGNGSDQTDRSWLSAAREHFVAFEEKFPRMADAVMIQSWNANPTRLLPESDPDTLTSLITVYTGWRSGRH
jgi:hypothetical protein